MFQLAKVWIDQEPGIGEVEIRFTCSPADGAPGGSGGEARRVGMEVVPGSEPRLRRALLDLPRPSGETPCLLRYRFHWTGQAGEGHSPEFSEEIVPADVVYEDTTGRLTDVRVLWSVEGWSAPNWSEATVADSGRSDSGREVPRHYVARVWGPRGAGVEYVYQLIRRGSTDPADDFVVWDNADEHDHHLRLA